MNEQEFIHLNVKTEYSVHSMAFIDKLMLKTKSLKMKSLAITDRHNIYGFTEFHEMAIENKIKPILACQLNFAIDGINTKQIHPKNSIILIAKNKIGYNNLVKLVSIANNKGFYYSPRIDWDLLKKYNKGLIVIPAHRIGLISTDIMRKDFAKTDEIILRLKEIFKDDLYLEIQRHKSEINQRFIADFEEQEYVNKELIKLSKNHNVKIIATNNVHIADKNDANKQHFFVTEHLGENLANPNRFMFTGQEWLKTQKEMNNLFFDIPEAIKNTIELSNKVEVFNIDKNKHIIPNNSGIKEYLVDKNLIKNTFN
jgi:DNA polymerase-3 subunit alpha